MTESPAPDLNAIIELNQLVYAASASIDAQFEVWVTITFAMGGGTLVTLAFVFHTPRGD